MAVKMLTFLGTTTYKECMYKFEEKTHASAFVQIALAQIFAPQDVYVFLTGGEQGSRNRNWEGNQRTGHIKGLKALSADLSTIKFHPVDIPDGRTEEELWDIFARLLEQIEDGDEIIFDITHSFRSLPLIASACIQYVRALKKITLRGIYYGAFEAQDSEGIAPIFDLTTFVDLMDWSQAVHAFTTSGHIAGLKKLLQNEATPLLKASKGQNIEGQGLRDLSTQLDALAQDLATCRGQNIYTYNHRKKLITSIETLKQEPSLVAALKPLLDLLEENIQSRAIQGSEATRIVRRGFEAVHWCLDHGQTQQAYTFLQETIITYVCLIRGKNYQDRDTRKECALALINASQRKASQSAKEQEWVQGLPEEIFKEYDALSKYRNDINHCGIVETIPAKKLQQRITNSFEIFRKHLSLT